MRNRTTCTVAGIGLSLLALGVAGGLGSPKQSATAGIDTAGVADTIINKCANVRYDELVLIEGGAQDAALLEDVAVAVRKLGAHPLVVLESDRLTRALVVDVDKRYDAQEPAFAMRLAEDIDALITIDSMQQPALLADVDPARLAARAESFKPVEETMLERGVIRINLGNGLYPTAALAEQYGISYDELAKIFWNGVNVDYDALQASGERVRGVLAAGREVRITAPNGTDLTLQVTGRPVFVSDGIVSSEDRYARGPACQAWLPAGEVYVTPIPGTADGVFVADTFYYEGKKIEKLTMTFVDGTMTSITGTGDLTALKKRLAAAPEGRDLFAALDIGINPAVRAPAQGALVTWMGAGTISVGIGGDTWAGGDNDAPFGLYAHLTNGTLTVDGKKIVTAGRLVEN